MGKYREAAEEFQKALQVEPNNELIYRELARSQAGNRDFKAAEGSYLKAIAIRSDYWAVYGDLGTFYYQRSRFPEAIAQYRQAVNLAPQNDRAWRSLGGIQTVAGQYPEAVQSLKTAIAIRPTYDAVSNLGAAYFRLRLFGDAVREFRDAATLNPREYIVFGNLARALFFKGETQKARAEWEHAIFLANEQLTSNPKDGDVSIMLASYYAPLGNRNLALLYLDQALHSPLVRPNFYWHAAIVYDLLDDPEQAFCFLGQAVAEGFSTTEIRDTVEFDNLRSDPRYTQRFAQVLTSNLNAICAEH
jgi:serine/threonine-protein kinase